MQKAERSEVKYKVRRTALLLKEFTAQDIVGATGLNSSSVRTELQRLKEEGFIVPQPSTQGSRPARYELGDDSEKRVELAQSVSAFEALPEGNGRPTSRFYEQAQRLLNRAQLAEAEERKHLIPEAEECLEIAEAAEGGALASVSIQAYLQYERARLSLLRSEADDLPQLIERIAALHLQFKQLGYGDMATIADHLLLCAREQAQLVTEIPSSDPAAMARAFLRIIEESELQPQDPLTVRLMQLLDAASQTAKDRIIDIANGTAESSIAEEIAHIKSNLASLTSLIEDNPRKIVSEMNRDRIFSQGATKEHTYGTLQKQTRRPTDIYFQ